MWLINSSIGRKVVMSVTGVALILFLTFHMSMNVAALFSGEAYNMICEFLGANWYALAGTVVLALGVLIHFIYAVVLTLNNYRARGTQRYAVTVQEPETPPAVAVIVAVPAATAVTTPSETVATAPSSVLHSTVSVLSAGSTVAVSVSVSPTVRSRVSALSVMPVAATCSSVS